MCPSTTSQGDSSSSYLLKSADRMEDATQEGFKLSQSELPLSNSRNCAGVGWSGVEGGGNGSEVTSSAALFPYNLDTYLFSYLPFLVDLNTVVER